ncbi:hypothetical protein POKO110462_12095 [Pontibacter korlensis]
MIHSFKLPEIVFLSLPNTFLGNCSHFQTKALVFNYYLDHYALPSMNKPVYSHKQLILLEGF